MAQINDQEINEQEMNELILNIDKITKYEDLEKENEYSTEMEKLKKQYDLYLLNNEALSQSITKKKINALKTDKYVELKNDEIFNKIKNKLPFIDNKMKRIGNDRQILQKEINSNESKKYEKNPFKKFGNAFNNNKFDEQKAKNQLKQLEKENDKLRETKYFIENTLMPIYEPKAEQMSAGKRKIRGKTYRKSQGKTFRKTSRKLYRKSKRKIHKKNAKTRRR